MKSSLLAAALLIAGVAARPHHHRRYANGTRIAKRKCHSTQLPDPTSTDAPTPTPTTTPPPSGGGGVGGGHFVVYADEWFDQWPDASAFQGWNYLYIAFMLSDKPADNAIAWQQLDESQRASIKQSYHDAGIKIVLSLFGATEQPVSQGFNPDDVAKRAADFVKQYDLDGIDVDFEDLNAFNTGAGAEDFIIQLTKTLRQELPTPQYTLTHAPLAPWFQGDGRWQGGGYLRVHQEVGDFIDFYNMQFYNQGDYNDCTTLFDSAANWPGTSVFELAQNGIPLEKIVVGKPGGPNDAEDGYMAPEALGACVADAVAKG